MSDATVDAEVKLLLPGSAWKALRKGAHLGKPRKRQVWFYESPQRELWAKGLILRARAGDGKDDTTVKLRGLPLAPELVAAFRPVPGFKLEDDWAGEVATRAASLTERQVKGEPPDRFSRAQLALVAHAGLDLPWHALQPLGPVRARTYTCSRHDLTVERWTVGDEELIEVSARREAPPGETLAALRAVLESWGLDGVGVDGGKTRWALERIAPDASAVSIDLTAAARPAPAPPKRTRRAAAPKRSTPARKPAAKP